MKKVMAIISILMIVAMMGSAFAVSNSSIAFRGIEWYGKYKDVYPDFEGDFSMTFENSSLDSINYAECGIIHSSDAVDDGGIALYNEFEVAGYDADTTLFFMYPIENGKSNRNKDDSEFYMAVYEIYSYEDMLSVYKDIEGKLISIYGEGTSKTNERYYTESLYWEDENGNALWLIYDDLYKALTQVRIAYAAGSSKARLAELREVLLAEKAAAEENERKQNAGNTSGL